MRGGREGYLKGERWQKARDREHERLLELQRAHLGGRQGRSVFTDSLEGDMERFRFRVLVKRSSPEIPAGRVDAFIKDRLTP